MAKKDVKESEMPVSNAFPGLPPITIESMKAIGRPTKISEEVIDTVTNFILRGNYIETSCLAAGITRQSYHVWFGKAAEEIGAGVKPEESMFIRFCYACEKARAQAEVFLTNKVMTRDAFWQRFSWMLERTRPHLYGVRQQIEITQDLTVTSVSLPVSPQDFGTWLSYQLTTSDALKSLRTNALDVTDAELVDDGETLEIVGPGQDGAKMLKDKKMKLKE